MTDKQLDEKFVKTFENVHGDLSAKARIRKELTGDNMNSRNITVNGETAQQITKNKAAVKHTGQIIAAAAALVIAVGGGYYMKQRAANVNIDDSSSAVAAADLNSAESVITNSDLSFADSYTAKFCKKLDERRFCIQLRQPNNGSAASFDEDIDGLENTQKKNIAYTTTRIINVDGDDLHYSIESYNSRLQRFEYSDCYYNDDGWYEYRDNELYAKHPETGFFSRESDPDNQNIYSLIFNSTHLPGSWTFVDSRSTNKEIIEHFKFNSYAVNDTLTEKNRTEEGKTTEHELILHYDITSGDLIKIGESVNGTGLSEYEVIFTDEPGNVIAPDYGKKNCELYDSDNTLSIPIPEGLTGAFEIGLYNSDGELWTSQYMPNARTLAGDTYLFDIGECYPGTYTVVITDVYSGKSVNYCKFDINGKAKDAVLNGDYDTEGLLAIVPDIIWGIVPDVAGYESEVVKSELRAAGFETEVIYTNSDTVEEGLVISTQPAAGETCPEGDTITVFVSKGHGDGKTAVPDVTGIDPEAAEGKLHEAKLNVVVRKESSDTVEEGLVVRTEPSGGAQVHEDDTVTIFVSKGSAADKTIVPNVVGLSREKAVAMIKENGLTPVIEENYIHAGDNNKVIAMSVDPDTLVEKGSEVTITVAVNGAEDLDLRVDLPDGLHGTYYISPYIAGEEMSVTIHNADDITSAQVSVAGNGIQTTDIVITNKDTGKSVNYCTYIVDFDKKTATLQGSFNKEGLLAINSAE